MADRIDDFLASWKMQSRAGLTRVHWFDRGANRMAACGAGWAGKAGLRVQPATTDNLCAFCEMRLHKVNRRGIARNSVRKP